jgi:hypothetical protein
MSENGNCSDISVKITPEVIYLPTLVHGYPEATRVRLKIANQTFDIGDYYQTKEDAEFMGKCVMTAMRRLQDPYYNASFLHPIPDKSDQQIAP